MKTEVRRLRGRCLDIWSRMTGDVIARPETKILSLHETQLGQSHPCGRRAISIFGADCLPSGRRASDLKKCSKLLSVLLNPRNDVNALAMTKSNDNPKRQLTTKIRYGHNRQPITHNR